MAASNIVTALEELEHELRRLDLWTQMPPEPDALQSEEPFSHDTLSLDQWLQWIFVPRIRAIVDAGSSLPGQCDIGSYAEMVFSDARYHALVERIRTLDTELSE